MMKKYKVKFGRLIGMVEKEKKSRVTPKKTEGKLGKNEQKKLENEENNEVRIKKN